MRVQNCFFALPVTKTLLLLRLSEHLGPEWALDEIRGVPFLFPSSVEIHCRYDWLSGAARVQSLPTARVQPVELNRDDDVSKYPPSGGHTTQQVKTVSLRTSRPMLSVFLIFGQVSFALSRWVG